MRWLTRTDLPGGRAGGARAAGVLAVSPEAGVVVPLSRDDRAAAVKIATTTLTEAGLGSRDRVLLAVGNDGTTGLGAAAAAEVAGADGAVASVGPRGRLRLQRALEAVGADTLVITPTGAMDFLARLHLEFLLDPLDLELRRILLVGEIPSPGCHAQLASEFDAEVVELYVDPFFELPLGWRRPGEAAYTVAEGVLGRALLKEDALDATGPEIVLTPGWHATLGDAVLRTGHVVGDGEGIPAVEHTIGDHVLVRGRWLSIPDLGRALQRIDGIARWDLRIGRAGTLDSAELRVTFARESLVRNPMWKGRIAQALVGVTPVHIDVTVEEEAAEETAPGAVTDLRGHHLGAERWS